MGMVALPVVAKAEVSSYSLNLSNGQLSCVVDDKTFTNAENAVETGIIADRIEFIIEDGGTATAWAPLSAGAAAKTATLSTANTKSFLTNANISQNYPLTRIIKARLTESSTGKYSAWSSNYITNIISVVSVSGDSNATYSITDTFGDSGTTGYGIEGQTITLTASSYAMGSTITWTNGSGTTESGAFYAPTVGATLAENTWTGATTAAFVPVTNIAIASNSTIAGTNLTLSPTITPNNATNQTIVWTVDNAGETGAQIDTGTNVLRTTAAGTAKIKATITNGETTSTNYTTIFDITVTNQSVTNITLASQTTTVNQNLTLAPTVIPSNATKKNIVWHVENANGTGATISGSTFRATTAGTATILATIVGGDAGIDYTKSFSIVVNAFKSATDITGIPNEITVGYDLSLSGNGIPTAVVPSDATYRTIAWNVTNQNGTNAVVNGNTFKATSAGTATVTGTIANGTAVGAPYSKQLNITVHKAPTISYDSSNRTLTVALPDKVITGYGVSTNITEVTGGYLEVFYNGSSVYNSGTSYQSSGKSFTISASNVESIISSLSSKFSGTTATIEFRLTPMGRTASNTSGYEKASLYATSGSVTVYQVAVGGVNITSATHYGLAGSSLRITATPAAGYSFTQWSDGNTSNPRTVTISTTTSGNGYAATAVLGANRSSSAAGSGAAGSGGGGTGNYDSVPKTGEGNAVLWLVVFVRRIVKKEPQTVQVSQDASIEKTDDFDLK